MTKFEKITLKDSEIREVDGEYEERFVNKKTYPAALTNHALNIGEKMGMLEGTNLSDVLKMCNFETLINDLKRGKISEENIDATGEIDTLKYLKVIYISLVGVNKELDLSFDEFTEKYHENTFQIMKTYASLVMASTSNSFNNFAKGLEDSTKKK
ncbi:hypothetical protein [Pontibacillus salipaludis]|uniref:Tail assembly chaperone n=1 Tax=Pontibacillus salipaludis TaxID=1697394 RepID=A0ABQ1PWL3_9BACI|nr:hypothetical protein [Pontibacillus salipaludis]GGD05425.1 hypothetical protein GCM10011389_11180 [Pontibacillus salipaludis]